MSAALPHRLAAEACGSVLLTATILGDECRAAGFNTMTRLAQVRAGTSGLSEGRKQNISGLNLYP